MIIVKYDSKDVVRRNTKYKKKTTNCLMKLFFVTVMKPGVCPADRSRSTESTCRLECKDDADCRGVGKCCARGCSQLCLSPEAPTLPPITPAPITQHVTTYRPGNYVLRVTIGWKRETCTYRCHE